LNGKSTSPESFSRCMSRRARCRHHTILVELWFWCERLATMTVSGFSFPHGDGTSQAG